MIFGGEIYNYALNIWKVIGRPIYKYSKHIQIHWIIDYAIDYEAASAGSAPTIVI